MILIFAVIVIVLSVVNDKKAIIRRKLNKAPLKRIASFRNREVAKFIGLVEFVDEPLIAPLSKRPCAYYHVLVERQVSSGKSTHWKTIIEETDHINYVVKDSSGVAAISKKQLKSHIVLDRKYTSGTFKDADANLEHFLNMHGHQSEGFFGFNKTLRYREGILEAGEKIAVLGEGRWRQAEEVGLPSHLGRILVMEASEKSQLYLSDDPTTTKKRV